MAIANIMIIPALLIGCVSLAVPILLQVFLSTRQNKWLGLILPAVSLIFALFLIFNMVYIVSADGWMRTCAMLLVPTAIQLLVYGLCRRHVAKKAHAAEIDQMNIQDL